MIRGMQLATTIVTDTVNIRDATGIAMITDTVVFRGMQLAIVMITGTVMIRGMQLAKL
jgi:hypothetical protein